MFFNQQKAVKMFCFLDLAHEKVFLLRSRAKIRNIVLISVTTTIHEVFLLHLFEIK